MQISVIAVPSHRLDKWGNTFKYAAEINADPATVRERSMEIHERGLASDAAKDTNIANLPRDPWLSYDVWLVNRDGGK